MGKVLNMVRVIFEIRNSRFAIRIFEVLFMNSNKYMSNLTCFVYRITEERKFYCGTEVCAGTSYKNVVMFAVVETRVAK